jgi:hypothetical protein
MRFERLAELQHAPSRTPPWHCLEAFGDWGNSERRTPSAPRCAVFIVLRNMTPSLRLWSMSLYGWLGCITLETCE